MPVWICAACAVEYPDTEKSPTACAICADERQFVPPSGQAWTTIERLRDRGTRLETHEVEPGLLGIRSDPGVGIGQQAMLVQTDAGSLLWDPIGFVDETAATLTGVVAIATSHPHMFGAQVEWSRALGGVPILVNAADRGWAQRDDPAIETWSGELDILPGVTLRTIGGHFPGSAVLHWDGGDGRGVVLAGDTFFPGPSERWVTFMRSFPNGIPLSAAVVERVAATVSEREFDRAYGNFGNAIRDGARAAVIRSAERYAAWVRGDHDDET
ncbi:MBL fold metallo-hydrolase [Lacisediminihabitans changchengi]|uniref:MBL fold metallo-hydrolase n=1 Tax=Lacisediminihabitans changchengi TaxID=2787634 RepID=A0A934SKX5_9MICO|nr:MBL fold metallo-hydrolase [Lacisediminihabitans changchengi]MBK4348592.1 MBL fold metallo-hydrolase [Lacisediminihabitans changchengi]